MPHILSIGEALIDFVSTQPGAILREAPGFEKSAGGAPANVAVGLARLGVSSGFIGRVGDDPFGHFLADTLTAEGVDVSQVGFDRRTRTGLAFVSLTKDGERDFLFYRHPSADMHLSPGHINPGYVKKAWAIVYGSIGLIGEPSRSGVLKALAIARDAGTLSVYDANLRLSLWGSRSEARYGLNLGLDRADIAKLSLDELEFLSGTRYLREGMDKLWTAQQGRMRLVIVTLGAQGCAFRTATDFGQIPGHSVATVDTTGAGDGFLAGLLAELFRLSKQNKLAVDLAFEPDQMDRALRFASAAGALTTTRRGAIPALPTRAQVEALL
jgi:sugar/nucleoside kinase (ribokinase family)